MQSYVHCAQSVIIFHYVNPEKERDLIPTINTYLENKLEEL